MRKTYITPESEIIEMELSGVLAASNPKTEVGYDHDDAPEMAYYDDVDDYYDDEE
ncbi:MAG: hypothetical protein J6I31_01535 [Prevotella sp.]|nr:hypothetical protein [Prevotella sp.]